MKPTYTVVHVILGFVFVIASVFGNVYSNVLAKAELSNVTESLYEIPVNCDFLAITNSNSFENECSPQLVDRYFSVFSGIIINGPKEVYWPKEASLDDFPPGPSGTTEGPLRLMIVGLVRVNYETFGLKGDVGGEIVVVAVNQKTVKTYSGKMPKPDSEPISDFEPLEPNRTEADRNALLSSHFNLDLVHDLNLPITDATYTVYATLEYLKSNSLTIKTKVK